ncbi:hypothetical protein J7443_02315 [Tropicibacter sp. R15_0]|uniref:hypothetical protein n=1 Tax=Tropicibacter sp. R15_0 TaxID=2821101 RepID=UPI001ADBC59F|nr:hypothetical protein [Tropicibacter sp. R15_0]MBO9464050.1 hypothetical protein [Tropicibacter sp. R15_0]
MASGAPIQNGSILPEVATLWIGPDLDWLHQMCLSSFVYHGHKVTLFYAGSDQAPIVPDGVITRPAADIWDPAEHGYGGAPASMVSDLFRLYLLMQTEMIWIDADVLCLQPFPEKPYHVGWEPSGTVNGAILRLPKESATLNSLIEWFEDPEFVPHWMTETQQAKVAEAEPGKRLVTAFKLVRPSVGPRALKHTLRAKKEKRFISPAEVYYPVRGVYTDVLFSPFGGVEPGLTEETLCVHLYASMIRGYHKKHTPAPGSFIAEYAREIEFDIAP